MRELRSEVVGDRRVALIEREDGHYDVTIACRGPRGWHDISLQADHALAFQEASARYRQRVIEQRTRTLD